MCIIGERFETWSNLNLITYRTQTYIILNYKSKNKTVIRADRVNGKFTTIPHRIINDKRLSTNARLLLISILSDADSFDFSRTGLCNRLDLTEYKLDKSLKELLDIGYLKKTKTHGQYFHYIVSEYGNLTNESEDPVVVNNVNEINTTNDKQDSTPYKESEQYKQDWELLTTYINERRLYVNFNLLKEDIAKVKNRNDVFEFRRNQDKEIKKNKKEHYKTLEEFVNGGYASKESKPKILKEVRRLITDEHKKPSTEEVNKIRNRISHDKYKNKVKKHGFDYETQLVDSYENPLD